MGLIIQKGAFFLFFLMSITTFAQIDGYSRIDKHARFIAQRQPRDYKVIAHKLVGPANTKMERVRAIYTWMSNYFQYDVDRYRKKQYRSYQLSIQEIVDRKKGICGDLAQVFKAMCDEVDIKCYYVTGSVPKRFLYLFPKIGHHAWNVVEIDGEWYHMDPTWGSGLVVKKKFLKKKIGRGKNWRQFKKNTIISHTLRWYFWRHPSSNYFAPSSDYFNKTHCADLGFFQLQDNVMHRFEFLRGQHKTIKKYQPYDYTDSIEKYEEGKYIDKRIFELENELPVIARRRFPLSNRYETYADSCLINRNDIDSLPQLEFYKTCYKRSIKYHFGNGIFFFTRHAYFIGFGLRPYLQLSSNIKSDFLSSMIDGVFLGSYLYYLGKDFFIHQLIGIRRVNKRMRELKSAGKD